MYMFIIVVGSRVLVGINGDLYCHLLRDVTASCGNMIYLTYVCLLSVTVYSVYVYLLSMYGFPCPFLAEDAHCHTDSWAT